MIVAAVPGRQVVVREPLFFLPRLLIIQRIRLWGHVQGGHVQVLGGAAAEGSGVVRSAAGTARRTGGASAGA